MRPQKFHSFDLQLFAEAGTATPSQADPKETVPNDGLTETERIAKAANEKAFSDLRRENQKTRERAEAAEREREDLKKWRQEREDKDLKEQQKHEERAEAAIKRAEEAEKRAADRDEQAKKDTMRERLRTQAVRRGIIDEDLVDTLDISSLSMESNRVLGIKELLDALEEQKPLYFRAKEDPNAGGPLERPRAGGSGKDIDARDMSPEEFQRLDAKMRAQRA